MAELTKTDAKYLALIKSYLDDLQVYVEVNICDGNAMTAAAIHEGFKEDVGCDLDTDTFVKGFRIAVRTGRITGIESAKRLGYRKIGDAMSTHSANDIALEKFAPYLNGVQKFVSERIRGEVRMTAAVIYKKFKSEVGCDLSEDDFVKSFRLAIREGKITGLETAYRFGYQEAGSRVKGGDTSGDVEENSNDVGEVIIDDHRRLVALDRFNWGYQVRKDSGTWTTESYFGNFRHSLNGVARKLLDDELKNMDSFPVVELEEKIDEAENRITELLIKAIKFNDEKSEKFSEEVAA